MADGEIQFKKVNQLKEGSYLLVDGIPCRVKEMVKSKSGKHGAAKARITTLGVFDSQKRVILKATSNDAEVPLMEKAAAQVVAVMGNALQLMDTSTYESYDIPNPKDIPGLKMGVEVELMKYGPMVKITRKKATE